MKKILESIGDRYIRLSRTSKLLIQSLPMGMCTVAGIVAQQGGPIFVAFALVLVSVSFLPIFFIGKAEDKAIAEKNEAIKEVLSALQKTLWVYIQSKVQQFLGNNPDTLRVSIYVLYKQLNKLKVIVRYSYNWTYDNEGSQPSLLKSNSGLPGKAFIEGEAEAIIKADPETDWLAYRHELINDYKMDPMHVDNLSMKSRHLKAKRIEGTIENVPEPIGVLLIETTNKSLAPEENDLYKELSKDPDHVIGIITCHEYARRKNLQEIRRENVGSSGRKRDT